jgi:hypothetical protein
MKKKYCDQESVLGFIWKHVDDGMWSGGTASVAAEFGLTEDEAYSALSELCDRGLIEKVYEGRYAIVKWRERDDPGAEELR